MKEVIYFDDVSWRMCSILWNDNSRNNHLDDDEKMIRMRGECYE